ncbi:MAG TPA: O-antigen ligase family protein [Bellilinea sp.]|nr:O-antigen ligase family protein [Bellilinea sp.]
MKNQLVRLNWRFILTTSAIWLGSALAVAGLGLLRGIMIPLLLTAGLAVGWVISRKGASQLVLPTLVFWLALLGSSLLSVEPHRSFYWQAVIGGGLLFTLLMARFVRMPAVGRQIVNGLLVTGGITAVIFYAEFVRWYATWLQAYPGEWLPWISFRLTSMNFGGAYMAGCALLAAGLALKTKSKGLRILLGVYALLAVGLIFLASSRGSLVGLAVAGVVWAVVERSSWLQWLAPVIGYFKKHKVLGIAVVAAAAAGVLGAGWILINVMSSHPTHGGGVLNARDLYWSVGWDMFRQSPLIGNGLYTFSEFFMLAVSVPPWDIFLHPHNMHLDVLSSAGIIGGAAYVWLLWAVFRALARARRAAAEESAGVVLGATLMLAGYLGAGIFDAVYHIQPASISLALVLGAALSFDPPVERKVPRWSFAVLGIGVCALAWWTAMVRAPAIQAVELAQESNPATESSWQAAAVKMDKAVELVPFSPLYQSEAGLMAAELAMKGETGAPAKAVEHFEAAVRLDPNAAPHHLNLGALYRSQGRLSEALTEFEEAARLAPNWDLAALQVGLAAEELGNTDQALRAYWKALKLIPDLGNEPFWQVSTLRQQAVQLLRVGASEDEIGEPLTDEAAIRQSYAGPILAQAELELQAGSVERATSLVSVAGLSYFRNGREVMEYWWLNAEIAAAEGDFLKASEQGEILINGLEVQGIRGPGTAGWSIYDTGIYRISDMTIELVPQVRFLRLFGAWPERMERLAEWQRLAGDSAGSAETLRLMHSWQE